jgi:NADPH:quinone reductase-like Zn-dependent oxidoreductase
MRAVGIERFGDTPQLREVPEPEPGPGQLRVAVEAAATNPLDLAIASGALAEAGAYRFPLTLGMDGAGTVTAVGAGVTGFRVGERVFGQFWSSPFQFGTFADVCVVQEAPALGALAAVPDELPSRPAAALPTAAMTALGVIEQAQLPAGGTLVVIGATGGVGTFAVQAAAARGLRVIATASTASGGRADRLRELGADTVLADGEQPLDQALRDLAPGGVDAVLDAVGDRALAGSAAGAVRDGGALISIAFGLDERAQADQRIRAANYRLDRKPELLAQVAHLAAAGTLRPVIGAEVPLEDVPRALIGAVPSTGGLRGKVVVQMG